MAKLKSKQIKILCLVLVVGILIYILLALLPYVGKVYVSEETRQGFSMEQFSGTYEIPERVMLVEEPQEAFFHRMNLIAQAQEEIILTTFAIHGGTTTDIIVGALLDSADRGVDVTILQDGLVGRMPKNYLEVLSAHENINIYLFNSFELLKPQYLNSGLHDKYLIIDNTFMLLGGRNIGDKYYNPESFNGTVSLDREVLVYNTNPDFQGSIIDTRNYFDQKINSDRVSRQTPNKKSNGEWEDQRDYYIDYYTTYREGVRVDHFDYDAYTIGVNSITLIFDTFDTTKKESIVAYNLLMLTKNSEVIIAQSPYLILTNRNFKTFAEAVNGKDFMLSTNSLASTPNLPAFSAYYTNRRNLLNTGISIYEYQASEKSLHGKTFLFDGHLTAIGSFNINERSIRSDTESMLIIDSEEFHDVTLEAINHQSSQSLRVGSDNNYELNSDVEVIDVSFGRKALYVTVGYVLRIFRFIF